MKENHACTYRFQIALPVEKSINLPTKWQTLLRMKYVLCSVRKGNTNNMMEKKWLCEILHIAGLLNNWRQLAHVQLRLFQAMKHFQYQHYHCNFCNTAFVTLSIKSSAPAYGGLAGPGSCSACSSFSSTRLRRLADYCSNFCKIVVFLFTLADTRRDILKREITQHQYTCKLETYSKLFHC